jgi:hypothetical protein
MLVREVAEVISVTLLFLLVAWFIYEGFREIYHNRRD